MVTFDEATENLGEEPAVASSKLMYCKRTEYVFDELTHNGTDQVQGWLWIMVSWRVV